MFEWFKNNWTVLLPIFVSVGSAIWTARISFRQKRMEDNLARSKAAYDIMLKKEFEFYEKIDVIYAELIPCIHDIIDSLIGERALGNSFPLKERQEVAVENYLKFLKSVLKLKNICLAYEIYIPTNITKANSCAITTFQNLTPLLDNDITKLEKGKASKINKDQTKKLKKDLLYSCAIARGTIRSRLEKLSKPV